MKKVLVLCMAMLLFASCERDTDVSGNDVDQKTFTRANKVDVCHKGKIINIDVVSVLDHQGHGDAVDMDGDGYFDIESDCSEVDCDDSSFSEDNSCQVCLDYEWGVFLNSIDLTNACRLNFGYATVLSSFGANGYFCCGLAVLPDGSWASGSDNNDQSGQESPESYQCFIAYLEQNNVPSCPSNNRMMQIDNKGSIFN